MVLYGDCFNSISNIKSKSVDLILTDPPYSISRKSRFIYSDENKNKVKHKYKFSLDFGEWDVILDYDFLFKEYYRVLKSSGTLILFYDMWKANLIKMSAEKNYFKQARIGIWLKNNPVPVNSKINYLSNAKEFFFSFTKQKNPTFNSEYDNGMYYYPICHGKERLDHKNQKPLKLIENLIEKHSNEGDMVLDTFAGTGTTGEACQKLNREFILIENKLKNINIIKNRLNLE